MLFAFAISCLTIAVADPGSVKSEADGLAVAEGAVGDLEVSSCAHPETKIAAAAIQAVASRDGVLTCRAYRQPDWQTGGVLDLTLDSAALAPLLIGATVRFGEVTIELTEVEAYAGMDDPAAHAFAGPRPHRLDLFAPPGTLYCYLSHGLHICGNITCGDGSGAAILLRAGRVLAGLEVVRARRSGVADVALARGPGNFGRAIGWTLADSGRRFGEGELELLPATEPRTVAFGPRVGVTVAHVRPWRFWADGDPTVSAYRASPRIPPGSQNW